jgi:hypothetical protein
VYGGRTVSAFSGDRDVGVIGKQAPQPRSGGRFIIHDHDGDRHDARSI